MIKVKGNLLMFDKPVLIDYIFPKECKIDIPDGIPITYPDHTKPIGKITKVERDDSCIRIEGEIVSPDEESIRKALSTGDLYASGYYTGIKIRVPVEDHIQVMESMKLRSVGLVSGDVYGDGSLRLEEVKPSLEKIHDPKLIIIHRYSVKDLDKVFIEIAEQVKKIDTASHRVMYRHDIPRAIIIDDLKIKFYSGDEKYMIGIRNVLYNTDSAAASEFLELRGCRAIPDIRDFVKYLINEFKAPI